MLELYGIDTNHLERLDHNDAAYRRTYFWRNSLRTLEEVKAVLNHLNANETFRNALAKEPPEVGRLFEELKKDLNRASEQFLYSLRSTISAHLDDTIIQATLDDMSPMSEGFIEVGATTGTIHYKFATQLLWAALLRDASEEDYLIKAQDLLGRTANLMRAIHAIDQVVLCYLKDRRLP